MFWLYALAMMVLALFIILYTPRSRDSRDYKENKEVILTVYKQQFDDLDVDVNNGTLTEEQAAMARLELEHALLNEMEGKNGKGDQVSGELSISSDWVLNGVIMLLLPVLVIALYYKLGQPDLVSASGFTATFKDSQSNSEELPSIGELVVGLEQRLQQTPDDEKGLWMLTRTYMALGRYADALTTVEHLYSVIGDDAAVLLLYANVLTLKNGQSFAGKPEELIQQALTLEPDSVSGLWLAGLAAQQRADHDSAIAYWQLLLPLVADDESTSEQVMQLLAEALGGQGKEINVAEASEQATSSDTSQNSDVIVEVSLSEELSGQAADDDMLFVFARAEDGLPMPVAVSRLRVADLPVTVILNDAMAMMPSRLLSAFEEVKITARISKTGNAIAQSGDLTSEVKAARVGGADPVKLTINQFVH